jgi:hypothetical protein
MLYALHFRCITKERTFPKSDVLQIKENLIKYWAHIRIIVVLLYPEIECGLICCQFTKCTQHFIQVY